MITIVLSNRNRDLSIVKKCLDSLMMQSETNFELFLIDYGSKLDYLIALEKMLTQYSKVKFIKCPVQDQLWNKSRAVNIVLKQTVNPYFLVGDIDIIFKNDFFETLESVKFPDEAIYFQVGFLSKAESQKSQIFEDYKVNHLSSVEATGITLFPTHILKSINGYDEFYHGWGAEDTDVHIRLKNIGCKVNFYSNNVLLLHQWHPKKYRSKDSTEPFHSKLEKINHSYMRISEKNKHTKINLNSDWGLMPNPDYYLKLNSKPDIEINLQPIDNLMDALIGQFGNFDNKVVSVTIEEVSFRYRIKNFIKKITNKKYFTFLSLELVNDMILKEIVMNYKNLAYQYSFDRTKKTIHLKIYFRK